MSVFRAVSELTPAQIWKGVLARPLHADRITIGFVDIDPGVLVPEHRHDNEQVGFVQRGSVTMTVAGQSRDLGVGETPGEAASALEFVLEGLHLSKRLNKDSADGRAIYRGRG